MPSPENNRNRWPVRHDGVCWSVYVVFARSHHLLSLSWCEWAKRTRQGINLLYACRLHKRVIFIRQVTVFITDRLDVYSFFCSFARAIETLHVMLFNKYIGRSFSYVFLCIFTSFFIALSVLVCVVVVVFILYFFVLYSFACEMAKTSNWRYLSLNVIQPIFERNTNFVYINSNKNGHTHK